MVDAEKRFMLDGFYLLAVEGFISKDG